MKIPAILTEKSKLFWWSLIFLFGHFYGYSQSCNCPPITTCGACQSGIISLTFRYNGFLLPAIVTADDANGLIGTFIVPAGTTFTITGSLPDDKFAGSILNLRILALLNASINTSCGGSIFVGSNFGDFTVIAGESKNGGAVCCQSAGMDAIPPVISACPTNIAAALSSGCSMPVSWTAPTATDNCGDVTLVATHNPGYNFPKGTTPVTYTATDDYGNTATCSFNVVVSDPILPV